jgi:hypothetical protein
MLKVSIHSGALETASRFNCMAWLDIGYEKLEPIADYKTVLYQNGVGATMPTPIYGYPRWSASLWDLVARALALGLRVDADCLDELVPPAINVKKYSAYATRICAVIEHAPLRGQARKTLASATVAQVGKFGDSRFTYTATFHEHTMAQRVTEPFTFHTDFLRPAELLLHACLAHLSGKTALPPRPALCVPDALEKDGQRYVPIHRLVEPARTGFVSWLHHQNLPPLEHGSAPHGIAPEKLYLKFLSEAV